jgi:rubrerythrin
MGILEIAKLCEFNSKAEAQAVLDYTQMIKDIADSDIADKDKIIEIVKELISDELNHKVKLQELYVYLTSIEPAKN